ncbi:uncharacterized protein LOC134527164 [Bacillus rossius redtenbacheri]|uniref:uncharacterized protein LOC134527164 n=1 Tax=Bacillus rossius redtenbacheri TaxID=93214 RepID=UPI002FDDC1A6
MSEGGVVKADFESSTLLLAPDRITIYWGLSIDCPASVRTSFTPLAIAIFVTALKPGYGDMEPTRMSTASANNLPPSTQPPSHPAPSHSVTQPPSHPAPSHPATQPSSTQPLSTQPPSHPAPSHPATQPPSHPAPSTQHPATQPSSTQPSITQLPSHPAIQHPATQPPRRGCLCFEAQSEHSRAAGVPLHRVQGGSITKL